jgi:dihydrofolate synthase/folylpolyglutamate synthase
VGASVRIKDTMGKYFRYKPKCYIMGMFKDKDYKTMVKNLCQYQSIDRVYTVSTGGDRSLSAEELAVEVRKYLPAERVKPCSTMKQLVRFSLSKANRNHLTLALGSLSFLSEFKKLAQMKFAEDEEKEKEKKNRLNNS